MNQLSNTPAEKWSFTFNGDTNDFQIQQSLGVEGKDYLFPKNKMGDQEISKYVSKPLVRPTSYTEFKMQSVNPSNAESKKLPRSSARNQNMSHTWMPVVSPNPMILEASILHNTPSQMPIQQTVRPLGFANMYCQWLGSPHYTPSQKNENFRHHVLVNPNQNPASALADSKYMIQMGTPKAPQDMTGLSISTTVMPADLTAKGGNQNITSECQSFVNGLNSPGVFSSVGNPMQCYFSPPCYINSSSRIGMPLMYCTSPAYISPTKISRSMPSIAMSLDVPPALNP
jgi:hypothetical protein